MNKSILLIIVLFPLCFASYRTGTLDTYLFGDSLDFSEITDSCQKRQAIPVFNSCTVVAKDVRSGIIQNHPLLIAPQGVEDLGAKGDTGCIDTLGLVPSEGYSDSTALIMGHLYAIRTSEKNYAVLHAVSMGSGLPFICFKWAYQPDGTPMFNQPTPALISVPFLKLKDKAVRIDRKNGTLVFRWKPSEGMVEFEVVDLRGKMLDKWECPTYEGSSERKIPRWRGVEIVRVRIGNVITNAKIPGN